MNPLISVIVLTYNQQDTIRRTLDNILNQDCKYTFELVIGEDGSSDQTRQICEQYVDKYSDIVKLMPKSSNKGLMQNYKDCLDVCTGKYIAICAGDDWWHNHSKLQTQIEFLENNEDYILSYSDALFYYPKLSILKEFIAPKPDNDITLQLIISNFIVAATVIYRSELLEEVSFQRFIDQKYQMEDYPLWLEFSKLGKFHKVNDATVTYTCLGESLSRPSSFNKQIEFIFSTYYIVRDFIQNNPCFAQYHEIVYDIFCDRLFYTAIMFKNKRSAIKYICDKKNKCFKDFFKLLLCFSNYGVMYLNRRYINKSQLK